MWYVVVAAVWVVVGFLFAWLWGSLARFTEEERQGGGGHASSLEEADPAHPNDANPRERVLPFPPSRHAGR
jgi:hypothetical protein